MTKDEIDKRDALVVMAAVDGSLRGTKEL